MLLLFVLAKLCDHRWKTEDILPTITIVLTVHNEEKLIAKRLDNLLAQDYPSQSFDILVASDGSTDKTNSIVESYCVKHKQITLQKTCGGGKSTTQNKVIPLAMGEIIILTDAGTRFEKTTLRQLVRCFADNRIGCVVGRLILTPESSGSVAESQGIYWKFEMALRKLESKIGIMHTASGQIMAFRKVLFVPFDSQYGDDCIVPLDILGQGYFVVHEDQAVAYDTFPSTLKGELQARIRMTLRNITCTFSRYFLLDPFRYPLLSIAIISHKLLRWFTPFFMIILFLTNIFLLFHSSFFLLLASAQCLFYLCALIGFITERSGIRLPIVSQIFSFVLANIGFFLGVIKALAGKRITSYRNEQSCPGA